MKLISFSRLKSDKGIDYTRVHLMRKVAQREFPEPIKLSERRIAWLESEVDDWISRMINQRPLSHTVANAVPALMSGTERPPKKAARPRKAPRAGP
jgi:prophage regulatory protein